MRYPNQEHQTTIDTMYHVHDYSGITKSFTSLKDARKLYRFMKETDGAAMITKTKTTEITLINNEHVQGYL